MNSVLHLDQRRWSHGDAAERNRFAHSLRSGLESTGFIRLEGHGVDRSAIQRAYAELADFFALPELEKQRCGGVAGGARGFTGFAVEHAKGQATPDLKEFFHVGQQWRPGHPRASEVPANVWPGERPQFRAALLDLFRALEDCATKLLEALASSYQLPERTFADMLYEGNSVLRAAHYPPLPPDRPAEALRAAPHEDINLITLLCEATGAGLEIQTPAGWLPVECKPGEIVVDAGDMLRQLTGGVIPSTTHRVVNPVLGSEEASRSRYSIPFFAHPPPECDLSVHVLFATAERVREFPPIRAGEFLAQRLREIGLTVETSS